MNSTDYITIGISDFVKERHVAEKAHSHTQLDWETLSQIVKNNWDQKREGDREGVVLVSVPEDLVPFFYTPMVYVEEDTKLHTSLVTRQEGEEPYVSSVAYGHKSTANYVDIVLYHKDVLAEDDDRSTDCDWEVICILARLTKEDEPCTPMTMARNFLHKEGGTKKDYTAEDFAESIWFWKDKVNVKPQTTLQKWVRWLKDCPLF